ncbi:hypothetical protein MYCTH_2128594 [Thermothelomyces thermophilus ATCC 42464]|uniref:Uncharacterized protein n=1 Tax=Thermothelomyces thermophilus (strain ATCC 42464 / BCRC 31852 / DSM 1799) TaxID=573729 RepID=G2QIK1_THET4|nr:uncharacterized protein MYCTH_2128594 [Thermothelomyces thermophilus ATCC 42464]AEO59532.1 hypothetical protein MYCTH_2128594 [Thermothelomyces thermophilus ATCC 42464]
MAVEFARASLRANHDGASSLVRLQLNNLGVMLASSQLPDVFLYVIDLLPAVSTKLLDRSDQQFVMSTFAGVAFDVCAIPLAYNGPADALEYLEKGRRVIIGQLVDARSDISSLEQQHPDIARRYMQLRDDVKSKF